jgi:hypothetical protein
MLSDVALHFVLVDFPFRQNKRRTGNSETVVLVASLRGEVGAGAEFPTPWHRSGLQRTTRWSQRPQRFDVARTNPVAGPAGGAAIIPGNIQPLLLNSVSVRACPSRQPVVNMLLCYTSSELVPEALLSTSRAMGNPRPRIGQKDITGLGNFRSS